MKIKTALLLATISSTTQAGDLPSFLEISTNCQLYGGAVQTAILRKHIDNPAQIKKRIAVYSHRLDAKTLDAVIREGYYLPYKFSYGDNALLFVDYAKTYSSNLIYRCIKQGGNPLLTYRD